MDVPQGVASWFVEGTFAISIVPSFCWADKVFVQRRGKIAVKQTLAECFSFYLIAQSVGSCPIWGLSTRLLYFVSVDTFQSESVASNP